uniref:Chitin-binding type-2 domain-containing protein n=1 Tax=Thelazia callipaeda TaxID=103827 RepID=A0A0N5DA14_THECL
LEATINRPQFLSSNFEVSTLASTEQNFSGSALTTQVQQNITASATTDYSTASTIRSRDQPRITGPPLRKPYLQASPKKSYKTRPGAGICPAGNTIVREQNTNYLFVCDEKKPFCPPQSYCFITAHADQEYNCCKA